MKMLKVMLLCNWVRARLLLYFGGETDAHDTRAIENHLCECPRCTKYSRKLSGVNNLVAECMYEDRSVPPTLASQVMNSIRSNSSQS